jgi:hypothetical protein
VADAADAPTEAFRRTTRPLEEIPAADPRGWTCGRCNGPVGEFSQGHYQSVCRAAHASTGFHFCCPLPAGCELQVS